MGKSSWHNLLLSSSFPVWMWVLTRWGRTLFSYWSDLSGLKYASLEPFLFEFYLNLEAEGCYVFRSQRKNWPLGTTTCHSYSKGFTGNVRALLLALSAKLMFCSVWTWPVHMWILREVWASTTVLIPYFKYELFSIMRAWDDFVREVSNVYD